MGLEHYAVFGGLALVVLATFATSGKAPALVSTSRSDAATLILQAHRAIRDEAEVEAAKDAAADARTAEKAAAREAMARTVGPKGDGKS